MCPQHYATCVFHAGELANRSQELFFLLSLHIMQVQFTQISADYFKLVLLLFDSFVQGNGILN